MDLIIHSTLIIELKWIWCDFKKLRFCLGYEFGVIPIEILFISLSQCFSVTRLDLLLTNNML